MNVPTVVVVGDEQDEGCETECGWSIVRVGADVHAATDVVARLRPSVVALVDVPHPSAAVDLLRQSVPLACVILVLAPSISAEDARACIASGAQFCGTREQANRRRDLIVAALASRAQFGLDLTVGALPVFA